MVEQKTLLTAEDLMDLPVTDRRYELLDGELIEMPPTNGQHGRIELRIGYEFLTYTDTHAGGLVLTGEPGIILRRSPDRVRAPDVCVWTAERAPSDQEQEHYLQAVPDIIVEVISPGDSASEIQSKVREWLDAGARLVWAVYPSTRTVIAYTSAREIRTYGEHDVIDAAPVFPDFSCPVANFFR